MNQDITLNLVECFYILRKRIVLIFSITIACTLVSGILSFYVIKPTYKVETSIAIGKTENSGNDKSQYDFNDVMMFQKLIKTYAEIGKSKAVAKIAASKVENLTAEQIQNMTTVTPAEDTQIIKIAIEGTNPQETYLVLNAVCNAFIQESDKVFPTQNVQIIDQAEVPQTPVKPKKMMNIAVAFFIGLLSSIGLVFLLEYLDNTFKTEEELSEYLGIPVIGAIPKNTGKFQGLY